MVKSGHAMEVLEATCKRWMVPNLYDGPVRCIIKPIEMEASRHNPSTSRPIEMEVARQNPSTSRRGVAH